MLGQRNASLLKPSQMMAYTALARLDRAKTCTRAPTDPERLGLSQPAHRTARHGCRLIHAECYPTWVRLVHRNFFCVHSACMRPRASVESRKGARPGPTGSRLFPFPAHQTGRAQLEHPAFRQTSPTAHGRGPKWTSRSRNTPNSPNTTASEKWVVPREATLWRDRRKFRTRS
jgi:hypothetical protein